jgi:hypothetical protein
MARKSMTPAEEAARNALARRQPGMWCFKEGACTCCLPGVRAVVDAARGALLLETGDRMYEYAQDLRRDGADDQIVLGHTLAGSRLRVWAYTGPAKDIEDEPGEQR